MPQKRNPLLLEHVQGRSAAPFGAFVATTAAMHAKPFTNSVAVSSEANEQFWPVLQQVREAVTLSGRSESSPGAGSDAPPRGGGLHLRDRVGQPHRR